MSMQNLAIVFGPTLFGVGAPTSGQGNGGMADATLQNLVCFSSWVVKVELIRCRFVTGHRDDLEPL